MINEKLLMTPGPTMLPPNVREAMGRQIIHHRTADFTETLEQLQEGLKYVFGCKNPVAVMASSGTGAMEAAVTNLFSKGDKVICVSIGNFGDRFIQLSEMFGLEAITIQYEWGEVAKTADIEAAIQAHPDVKGVLITQNETSTGVSNDVKAVAELTKNTEILLVVDAISALGGIEMRMDEWGIDCVVAGSQKGLMASPGLGFAALSDKAWAACEKCTQPRFYFDLRKYRKGIEGLSENPPYTPAITTMQGQAEALKNIREEGLPAVYARHARLAKATQKAVQALHLELLPDAENSSNIITAVKVPDGLDIAAVLKTMNKKFDIMLTGGQKALKGKIFRIGHCGFVSESDLIKTFSALERALAENGYTDFTPGASLVALQEAFMA